MNVLRYRYLDLYYDEWERKASDSSPILSFFKKSNFVYSNVLRNKLCHFDIDQTSFASTFKNPITYY